MSTPGLEKRLGDAIYQAFQDYSNRTPRSMQSNEFRIGVSDLGFCSERTKRALKREVPQETDVMQAFLGTAIGALAEEAVCTMWPHAVAQSEVNIYLPGDGGVTYHVQGHPDLVIPASGDFPPMVLDGKTTHGLTLARRMGASQQQRFQRSLYGAGALADGLLDCDPDDLVVGNFWIDRTGRTKSVHVETEVFDPAVVDEAARWLDEVVYAYKHGTEAMKEPPREMCAVACGFFNECRMFDTTVQGLIEEPLFVSAARMYDEGRSMSKAGEELRDEAKTALVGVEGSTGEFMVKWLTIEPEGRAPYDRLEVRKIPLAE